MCHNLRVLLLRYIARTVDFGIWYPRKSDFNLVGYNDSDWAGCTDDRTSTSGHVFSLFLAWGLVQSHGAQRSKK